MINQETGVVIEIERSHNLKNKNLISYIESGAVLHEGGSIQSNTRYGWFNCFFTGKCIIVLQ